MSSVDSEDEFVEDLTDCVTYNDVNVVVQKVTNESEIEILEYNLNPYSNEKLGLLGYHQELKITYKKRNSENEETLDLFVKSIPYDAPDQANFVKTEGFYDKESSFFSKIIPELTKGYTYEKWAATCYLVKKDTMILQDLRCQGYKLFKRIDVWDKLALLKSGLAAVARFHSCSIVTETRLSQLSKHPVKLNDLYPEALIEKVYSKTVGAYRWLLSSVDLIAVIAERLGHDPEKLRCAFERIFEIVKPSKSHRNVICHGDLWTNNIMFDNAKSEPKCVFVDFQLIRYAPLVLDILHILYLHTSRKFRMHNEKELIKFYCEALEDAIKSNNYGSNVNIPTLEEISIGIEEFRIFGAAIACLYFQIHLLDPKTIMECTKNSESYEKFMHEDRVSFTLACMDKDKYFKDIYEECVTELVEISEAL